MDKLSQIIDPYGRTTNYIYTAGLLTKVVDFAGREVKAAGVQFQYAYDTADNLIQVLDGLSRPTNYAYCGVSVL